LGTFGIAKLGSGLIVNGDGDVTVSVPYATTSSYGLVKLGSNFETVTLSGAPYLRRVGYRSASTGGLGLVRVNSTFATMTNALQMDGQVVNFNVNPTSTRYGIAKVNNDANNFGVFLDNNTIYMFVAGNFGWGYLANALFVGGSGLSIASDGTLSYAGMPAVPTASDTVLGKVQLGGGLSVTEDGTVSLTNLKPATTTELGTVRAGDEFSVNGSGVITPKLTSITQYGIARFQTGQWITTAVPGHQTTAGWRPVRTNSGAMGVVINGNTDELDFTNGMVTLKSPIARKNVSNTFTGSQVTAIETVAVSTSSYTPDFSTGNVKDIAISVNTTIMNPVNVVAGTVIQMIVKKSANGNTFAFDTAYKLNATLNNSFTSAQALMLSCICLSSSVILVVQGDIITL
jgi:hypothetical protein